MNNNHDIIEIESTRNNRVEFWVTMILRSNGMKYRAKFFGELIDIDGHQFVTDDTKNLGDDRIVCDIRTGARLGSIKTVRDKMAKVLELTQKYPSVMDLPVLRGKWIQCQKKPFIMKCSVCGSSIRTICKFDIPEFCPKCFADMGK